MVATDKEATADEPVEVTTNTDSELLATFLRKRDSDSFTSIVERHHAMVFGIAKRMLGCSHLAEDVVQATFLVLARKGNKIRSFGSLSSWLYGVAVRISARSAQQRARSTASTLKDEVMVTEEDPLERLTAQFEQNTVFEELQQLPEKLRTPMVLRYLKGKSNLEVAEHMSLSESAVEGRLKRGRNQLRLRLARQGVTFSAAVMLLDAVRQEAAATTLPQLIAKTVTTSLGGSSTSGPGLEANVSHEAIRLAQQEIWKMTISKAFTSTLVATLLTAVGWGLVAGSIAIAQGVDPFGDLSQGRETADVIASPAVQTAGADAFPTKIVKATNPSATKDGGSSIGAKGPDTPFADMSSPSLADRLKKLGHFSVDNVSENEVQILEALQKPATLSFEDALLHEVIEQVKEEHHIQILFDAPALSDQGIEPTSETVSFSVKNIKLDNALKLMLASLQLKAVPANEVLLITSEERADEMLVTRIYPVDSNWKLTEQQMMATITKSVESNSWEEVGGPGKISIVPGGLMISNSHEAHTEINQLLAQFDTLYRKR